MWEAPIAIDLLHLPASRQGSGAGAYKLLAIDLLHLPDKPAGVGPGLAKVIMPSTYFACRGRLVFHPCHPTPERLSD
jgi:hypothetical protein